MVHDFLGPSGAFFITSLISLFVIIDPPANIFPYLALSGAYPPAVARALAWKSCLYAFVILALFALLGRYVLEFFGIRLPAFEVAGGVILLRISLDMMEGRGHFNRIDTSSSLVAADYRDVALVPLAMPLMSGPGAITAVLVLTSQARSFWQELLVLLAAAISIGITYLFFSFARHLRDYLSERSFSLVTRLMGLILAALAVQFVIEGLKASFPSWH
jgi:multiple antibiotic resistance protein